MRKLITITQVSLDGVMQAPGGPQEDPSNGFTQGGWAKRFFDEAAGKAISELINSDFEMLLGRRTYEIFASFWPLHDDDPIGKAFNRANKYVVTNTLDRLAWAHSNKLDGNVLEKLRRLKEMNGPPLHVWGSSNLLQTLIAEKLVDEYRMWVFPVVLGNGKRMFENDLPPLGLSLVESHSTPAGVLINTYHPAGPLQAGE